MSAPHAIRLPVFASRVFRHGFIVINERSGIRSPKDLEGKRVGVPLYTMSAAIWIRGHLQHDHGVDLSTIRWVQGATNKPGAHGAPTILPMVRQPRLESNPGGKSLSRLLEESEPLRKDFDMVIEALDARAAYRPSSLAAAT